MKKLLLVSSLMLSTTIMAAPSIPKDLLIGSIDTKEVSSAEFAAFNEIGGIDGGITGGGGEPTPTPTPEPTPTEPQIKPTIGEKAEQAGKVIQAARDFVALGEAIYELVNKGRPTNVTEYAPISVVPRDPTSKEIVDIFDMEGFSMPVEKNYVANIKNMVGKEVVQFSYKVMYSYGGSYNGTGKYLTGVILVPGSVKTSYGWNFNATMKLSGMMNHGTKANPVAGVLITVKYQMNSWNTAFERNDTIHITGNGDLKNFNK